MKLNSCLCGLTDKSPFPSVYEEEKGLINTQQLKLYLFDRLPFIKVQYLGTEEVLIFGLEFVGLRFH